MTTLLWPLGVLKARSIQFDPEPRTRSGGVALSGAEQVVASSAGRWKATLGAIAIRNSDQIRVWRALQGSLEGRVGVIAVPLCDCARAPWPVVDGKPVRMRPPLPHSDDALFSDGTGYWQGVIASAVTVDAKRGATTLFLRIDAGNALQGAEHFSIDDRLYRIKAIDSEGTIGLGALSYTVRIWPPLRAAAPAGTALNFDQPVCRMRLASDDAMDLALDLNRFSNPTVSFVEDF